MTYMVTYVMIWWILFFMSLPIGLKEKETNTKKQYKKEVTKAYLIPKVVIVSLLTIPVTYLVKHYADAYLLGLLLH